MPDTIVNFDRSISMTPRQVVRPRNMPLGSYFIRKDRAALLPAE